MQSATNALAKLKNLEMNHAYKQHLRELRNELFIWGHDDNDERSEIQLEK